MVGRNWTVFGILLSGFFVKSKISFASFATPLCNYYQLIAIVLFSFNSSCGQQIFAARMKSGFDTPSWS